MRLLLDYLERLDWLLFASMAALTAVGLIAIYGIGISQDPPNLFLFYKQLATVGIGLFLIAVFAFIDYRQLRSFGFLLFVAGAGLLILVLLFGSIVNGTQGWFRIGSLSFQPVEVAKMTLACYLAAFFAGRGKIRLSWRDFGLSFAATSFYAGLVLLQPDFGSAMVLFAIWGCMSLFAGLPRYAIVILPVVLLASSAVLWTQLADYQKARIESFLDPSLDPRGSGYNAIQARIAFGSGGWFGKGIGEGSQARLRFLPAASTDFIFAVVGEEMGLVGVAVIFGTLGLLSVRYMKIAFESEDEYAALLLIGLGTITLVHITVNAGMNLGVMPITGIPFPFLSAAASFMITTYASIGIAQSIAVRRRRSTDAASGGYTFDEVGIMTTS
ncbi:MAG TPA: FtsW/RodA/SpoVE family cell cycle protein [bacterium]|nr:rod shape-determining protein RodA [Candidatus Magasanikbacteria bacterium]MCA9389428.1 rod shape-determining protein RodA [Candidatus Magasanikbacteria bacterium]HPF95318.1 FtsW/RodA/SpoVE family cell cycle protein [bacterium]